MICSQLQAHAQGGKAQQPVLREDQLLGKLRRQRKAAEEPDPFAPEYNPDTWLQACSQACSLQISGAEPKHSACLQDSEPAYMSG